MTDVVNILKSGGLVAFPTDTVYGLAVCSDNEEAVKRLQIAKGRPEDKPFPMMVANYKQIAEVASFSVAEEKIMKALMPGALTMIYNKKGTLPEYVTNGFSTVGIRMPDDEWIIKLIKKVGCPLLVPSANLSGEVTCLDSDGVLSQLAGRIDAVIVGKAQGSLASTIIDARDGKPKIIRQGIITLEEIEEVLK